ncbi:MAG: hypothetical protein E7168_00425 [Firmicutes bacterium]|nr:hypothetical protein [Bacillota bacterium]
MKEFYKVMLNRTFLVIFCLVNLVIIADGNEVHSNMVHNVNGVRSLEVVHRIYKVEEPKIEVIPVSTMQEAAIYGPNNPISFVGQMTAYKPNCLGCTGYVSCPPRQDVRNGNIYFQDSTYGTLRIMAADPNIPCGTVVKMSNLTFSSEPIMGIVLDRGGVIKGNIMDFLVSETDDANVVGRQFSVQYEVVRWGW